MKTSDIIALFGDKPNKKIWLVDFSTDDRNDCQIVIHSDTKDGVKNMLKRHMAGKPYRIKKITERGATNESK
jgi:hypothetical protein